MKHPMKKFIPALCLALALPALAESSTASSVSDSASSATSSASDSFEGSSKSSSGEKKVAAGEYQVVRLAVLADKPGMLRAQLRNEAGAEFALLLPARAAERGHLAEGGAVNVIERPYGYEFASADTREAFFLVLEDDWHRELRSKPVTL
jgi:hypothetical protein